MASRKPRAADVSNLVGKQIVVKYAEGDFHGTIVRKGGSNKWFIQWEGDDHEDAAPLVLDPKRCGKQFKAEQNGWEVVEAAAPAPESEPSSPVSKRATNKRGHTDAGMKVNIKYSESGTKPSPAPKKAKTSDVVGPLSVGDQLLYIRTKLEQLGTLQPTLTAAEVKDFETTHRITLPDTYRQFVTTIANGVSGSLCTLDEGISDEDEGPSLTTAWPFCASQFPAASELYLGYPAVFTKDPFDGDDKVVSVAEQAIAKKFERTDGLLRLGGACPEVCEAYLVVTGESKGSVWMVAKDHFGPFKCGEAGGTGFLDWFLEWLDQQVLGSD